MPPLLMISYFTNIRGNCPAEWADDKIRVLESMGRKVIVLTGMGSHTSSNAVVHYIRVPSLSWCDYKEEIKELKLGGEKVPLALLLLMPFAFLFGGMIDYVLRKITKTVSAGRWSWLLTAIPVAIWLKARYRIIDVFSTGGPTAAHIVGGVITSVSRGRLFCEFQDPLVGVMMNHSKRTSGISARIEAWLLKRAMKVIYVTKKAAQSACERNPHYAEKVHAIYPGAWSFGPSASLHPYTEGATFEFMHLGTLYGTRNLDLFFEALDMLRSEGFKLADAVRVVNLGAVYCQTLPSYLSRTDFLMLDALEREEALQRARGASCLLLVQHTDERSMETIPYKTYDYLNLGLPTLGLLINDELSALLESNGGFTARADQRNAIKVALRCCLTALANGEAKAGHTSASLDISVQFKQMLECADA